MHAQYSLTEFLKHNQPVDFCTGERNWVSLACLSEFQDSVVSFKDYHVTRICSMRGELKKCASVYGRGMPVEEPI